MLRVIRQKMLEKAHYPFLFTILFATGLFAQAVLMAQSSAGRPDLSGVWMRTREGGVFGKDLPPLRPEAKRVVDENSGGTEEGLDEMDPSIYCLPHGTPRAWTLNYPFEIVQTPDVVHILHESSLMRRRIFLDGRRMPENYPTSYMGFSSGRYQGDALVVETAGLDDSTWLDARGIPHSTALKLTERIRRASPTTLEVDFTFDDPKTFTRTWSDKRTFELQKTDIMEHIGYCEDRFRYNNAQKVFRGTVRWQSPEQAESSK
jgi:hypothetical protein